MKALVASAAAAALLLCAPALAQDAEASASHPAAGDYVGHASNGQSVHFVYANHRIDDLLVGPHHDPTISAGAIDVHDGTSATAICGSR